MKSKRVYIGVAAITILLAVVIASIFYILDMYPNSNKSYTLLFNRNQSE